MAINNSAQAKRNLHAHRTEPIETGAERNLDRSKTEKIKRGQGAELRGIELKVLHQLRRHHCVDVA